MRSRGAFLLARLSQTQARIAQEIGVSVSLVNYWLSGERKPGLANRKALLARYKIPIESWEQEQPARKPTTPPASPAPPAPPPDDWGESMVLNTLSMLEETHRENVIQNRRDTTRTPLERADVHKALLDAEGKIRKMKGELAPEVRVVDHPKWQVIKRALLDALKAHPKALRDVIAALERLEDVA